MQSARALKMNYTENKTDLNAWENPEELTKL